MKSYIGIDFGAVNIKAAKVSSTGKIQNLKLNKGQSEGNFIPNVILYDKVKEKLEIKVGKSAKRNILDYKNKVWQIKQKLAQKGWTKFIENLGREVDAAKVVKDIFTCVWQTITTMFPQSEEFDVAITVPVSFSEVQKKLIRQAAVNAGIPVMSVITEPFAAIFSPEEFDEDEQVILIFDFGGSTLDLSLCRIERDDSDDLSVKELAAAGLKFGGNDIDNAIYEKIFCAQQADKVKNFLGEDPDGIHKVELKNLIEQLKEDIFLDDEDEESGQVSDANGNLHEFTLRREEIISVLDELNIKEKIATLLDELLDDAQLDKSEVTKIGMFGGTSSIDYFHELLAEYFGKKIPANDFEVEEIYMSVAQGAANYRYLIDTAAENITIENVIPYSIGLADGTNFKRLIKRNELCGFVTPFKPLLISDLEKKDWRVAIYQSFGNEFCLPLSDESVIFIGDVKLDRKLYTARDAILFKMQPSGDGQIVMRFFEQRPDLEEPALVEEKIVEFGG